ncbi:ABC transporter permease [Parablautia muri]|uniref:Uncharacterized protein n=1 Tax=Parablautia muri TaxID=2320879 RepID=A0A9X5BFN1_9FIRM|nr:ABC transporter permease [Parablautia muri]NBJ93060.1 hypothetical protein [Parablautia muri]
MKIDVGYFAKGVWKKSEKKEGKKAMFGALFLKECRQVLKSLVYYIYVVVFVLFINSQMSSESVEELQEPVPGQTYYGETVTQDETLIMEGTLADLVQDVCHNSFATYPLGFYKGVNLTAEEIEQAEEILKNCTGKSMDELKEEMEEHFGGYAQNGMEVRMEAAASYRVPVKEGFTYEDFETAMEEVCHLVGRGSFYEKESYENRVYVPMTYEQAREEFDALCTKDNLTRAYIRLFCDYAGIVLAILPIFVGVSGALRDKRAKVQQVMFSKPASGALIVVSRYLANLVMLILPVVIVAFLQQRPYYDKAKEFGVQGDMWAFLTVPGVWLLPEVMIVLAFAFLITELTDSIAAIFIQVAWGIASLFGASTLVGNFGLRLVARWNTFGSAELYDTLKEELFLNRGYYFLLAVICVLMTVIIYEIKRKMGTNLKRNHYPFEESFGKAL